MKKKLRAVLCALFGHPPIARNCFGYITCARCDAQLGDTLGGCYSLTDMIVLGHTTDPCQKCDALWEKTRFRDRFLTPKS